MELIGKVLAKRYTIVEKLGHGGYGDVYRAFDANLQLDVVVKKWKRRSWGGRCFKATASGKSPYSIWFFCGRRTGLYSYELDSGTGFGGSSREVSEI